MFTPSVAQMNEFAIQSFKTVSSSKMDRNWGESGSWEGFRGTRELVRVENGINPLSRITQTREHARWTRIERR